MTRPSLWDAHDLWLEHHDDHHDELVERVVEERRGEPARLGRLLAVRPSMRRLVAQVDHAPTERGSIPLGAVCLLGWAAALSLALWHREKVATLVWLAPAAFLVLGALLVVGAVLFAAVERVVAACDRMDDEARLARRLVGLGRSE